MLLDKTEQNETEGVPDWSRIHLLCLQRGWDLGQLAREAGISRTTLYHWQTQKTEKPRFKTLFKLAEALGVEPLQLILRPEGETGSSSQQGSNQPPVGQPPPVMWSQADLQPDRKAQMDRRMSAAFDQQTNWSVQEVCERSPELFRDWSDQEWEELFSSFGTGGELNERGVLREVAAINQRRETLYELQVVLETHLADAARRIIHSLYESVQCPSTAEEGRSTDEPVRSA